MNGFEKAVKKLLKNDGWKNIRSGKGSHQVWFKTGKNAITVPKNCKSRHTANAVLKQAGLSDKRL